MSLVDRQLDGPGERVLPGLHHGCQRISHRARTSLGRETSFFFGINLVTLIFSELTIALFVYGFGYGHTSTMVFVVNIATIGLGTVFRFWSYKRFVFLHPDKVRAPDVDLDVELAE